MKIIDLQEERERRDGPDAEHVCRDQRGQKLYRFTCSYLGDDGRGWCFDLWASSYEDAEARLNALKRTGSVDGQVYSEGPL